VNRLLGGLVTALALLGTASCSHAPPQVVQVFTQVDRVFEPSSGWSARLSVFVQGADSDGTKVFDRLHLVHEGLGLYFTLDRDHWTAVERPGESWFGANDLSFPDGKVPLGEWRATLVTKAGLRVQTSFQVPPQPPDAPAPRTAQVEVSVLEPPPAPVLYQVSGWVDDYLVWARDAKGTVLTRNKTVGDRFGLPPGTESFLLYSYDKARGEGLVAGPFSVKEVAKPADR
jgi:hypothetical protein